MHGDATALLIIRARLEEGSSQPLRAQVRTSLDVSTGIAEVVTVVHPDAVRACVDEWLAAIAPR